VRWVGKKAGQLQPSARKLRTLSGVEVLPCPALRDCFFGIYTEPAEASKEKERRKIEDNFLRAD